MDKWPDVFSDMLTNVKRTIHNDPFGESVVTGIEGDIKVENPQPYIDDTFKIPEPEVKE